MAKTFEFTECSVVSEFFTKMKDKYGMLIPDSMIAPIVRTVFRSFATMMKYNESKSIKKMGFSVRDDKGIFKIGVILNYNPPEDEESEDVGNFVLSMTFDESDLESCDQLLDERIDTYNVILQTLLFSEVNTHCDDVKALHIVVSEIIDSIVKFLDENSNDSTEDVELEMKSVFTAGVSIENGAKHYYIIPGYSVKQIIKNDDENEKEAA